MYWHPDHADHVTYVLLWWDFQNKVSCINFYDRCNSIFVYTEGCYKLSDDDAIWRVNEIMSLNHQKLNLNKEGMQIVVISVTYQNNDFGTQNVVILVDGPNINILKLFWSTNKECKMSLFWSPIKITS